LISTANAETTPYDFSNEKRFLESKANQFHIRELSDWYQVPLKVTKCPSFTIKCKDFPQFNGKKSSPPKLLAKLYPEYEWLPWKFEKCPKNYWDDVNNQKKFIDWAGKQLNIKEMTDWYNVTRKVTPRGFYFKIKDLTDVGGAGLMYKFKDSPSLLMSSIFPEYEWLPWRFSQVPNGFWENVQNQRKYIDWAEKQLKINEKSDWYKVSYLVGPYGNVTS
jgi:5-hydroxyisourate hydrolase-like protein (transthyretin family)